MLMRAVVLFLHPFTGKRRAEAAGRQQKCKTAAGQILTLHLLVIIDSVAVPSLHTRLLMAHSLRVCEQYSQ